ncbi:MAG: hypothetical protein IPP17_06935 [Bacteroidetes bacterium]|nr:hypothetical protein [Bacteroidota bacterium]
MPGLLDLDVATPKEVWEHLQKVLFYENATNPQISEDTLATGKWQFGTYFNFNSTTNPSTGTNYSYSCNTNSGTVNINFVRLQSTSLVFSTFSTRTVSIFGAGPGNPRTAAAQGCIFPADNVFTSVDGIEVLTNPLPINPSTGSAASTEASSILKRFSNIINAGCGLFEKKMAFDRMIENGKPFRSRVRIPKPVRSTFPSPAYEYPWPELYDYQGQAVWPPNLG